MRKLMTFCLFMVTVFTVNAQTKGPSKEQTITFIKDYFAEHQNISRTMGPKSSMNHKNIKIAFSDCLVTISWDMCASYYNLVNYPDKTVITKYEVILDFKNIESVAIRPYGNNDENGEYQVDLTLKAAPNTTFEKTETFNGSTKSTNVKEINIPVNSYSCSSCDHSEYSKKILQAFNHLRKLCGAPEPISFD